MVKRITVILALLSLLLAGNTAGARGQWFDVTASWEMYSYEYGTVLDVLPLDNGAALVVGVTEQSWRNIKLYYMQPWGASEIAGGSLQVDALPDRVSIAAAGADIFLALNWAGHDQQYFHWRITGANLAAERHETFVLHFPVIER